MPCHAERQQWSSQNIQFSTTDSCARFLWVSSCPPMFILPIATTFVLQFRFDSFTLGKSRPSLTKPRLEILSQRRPLSGCSSETLRSHRDRSRMVREPCPENKCSKTTLEFEHKLTKTSETRRQIFRVGRFSCLTAFCNSLTIADKEQRK